MTIETLRSLQKRIREATGADRELDWAITQAFSSPKDRFGQKKKFCTAYTTYPDGLGACVALMRDVLPGCEWTRDADGEFALWRRTGSPLLAFVWISEAPKLANDCLTFLDAICAAKIAELEADLVE